MAQKDYYSVLGVRRNASPVEIKRQYRGLVKLHHPDHNPGLDHEARFRDIAEAYATLSNPQSRIAYDGENLHRPVENPLNTAQEIWHGWFLTQLKGEGYATD